MGIVGSVFGGRSLEAILERARKRLASAKFDEALKIVEGGLVRYPGATALRDTTRCQAPVFTIGASYSLRALTAVPYAQISVHVSPISDVSKRIARTAFPPRVCASSVSRSITC